MQERVASLIRLKVWRRESIDARREVVTTHREASPLLTPPIVIVDFSSIDTSKLKQPGDGATELFAGDAQLIAEREANKRRRSWLAAEAYVQSGAGVSKPIDEPEYPTSKKI